MRVNYEKMMLALLVVALGVGGYFSYKYYSETYQGVTAYARTPKETPERKQTVDGSGKKSKAILLINIRLNLLKKMAKDKK
ncbi:hypothetical protein HSIEG1_2948 [Enterococcus sp. HSIEG1]|nr:hypothetical protein HSIEG1_2948 [Enterococcus sp. HSIEG1]